MRPSRSWSFVCAIPMLASCSAAAPAPRTVEVSPPPPAPAAPADAGVVAADSNAPAVPSAASVDKESILPAGLCSFPNYLAHHEACEGVPATTHVVLLGEVQSRAAAESLLAAWVGKLPPGYPMVLAKEELPLDGEDHVDPEARRDIGGPLFADLPAPRPPPRRASISLRIVAGIFAGESAARAFDAEKLGRRGTIHRIAGAPRAYPREGDTLAFNQSRHAAVVIAHSAPAYAHADIDRGASSVPGVPANADEDTRWEHTLAKLKPACAVRTGQVFVTNHEMLYDQGRRFAPVECDGGKLAWVERTATTLESVVRVVGGEALIFQVLDVMCDTAAIDRRPFAWGAPLPKGRRARAGCGRGRS